MEEEEDHSTVVRSKHLRACSQSPQFSYAPEMDFFFSFKYQNAVGEGLSTPILERGGGPSFHLADILQTIHQLWREEVGGAPRSQVSLLVLITG